MAHPDYSILIVEAFNPSTTAVTQTSYIFSNVTDARAAFQLMSSLPNNRLSLFEQPQPSQFKRDDSVPLPATPVIQLD